MTELSSGERARLAVGMTIGAISALLSGGLLVLLFWYNRRERLRPIGLFFATLLWWDFVLAWSWLISIRWLTHGTNAWPSAACHVQAITDQLSASGAALASIGLSWTILHEYVFVTRRLALRTALIVWGAMLALQLIVIAVANGVVHPEKLYGPSGFWCWIPEDKHYGWKIGSQYIFYWTGPAFSLVTAILYLISAYLGRKLVAGFFWIGFHTRNHGLLHLGLFSERRTFGRESASYGFCLWEVLWAGRSFAIGFWQYLKPPRDDLPMTQFPTTTTANNADPSLDDTSGIGGQSEESHQPDDSVAGRATPIRDAMKLLTFPICYAILIIPMSIVRIRMFQGHHANSSLVIWVGQWYELAGLVEVALFLLLRPDFGFKFPRLRKKLKDGPGDTVVV